MGLKEKNIVGIDLGTTNSCVAVIDEYGKPIIGKLLNGQSTLPSIIFFESSDHVVVGEEAKEEAELNASQVARLFKYGMGNEEYRQEIFGISYSAEELSAKVLKKLMVECSELFGFTIEEAVITCPAYYGSNERKAVERSGEIAGLKVHMVINEPTAAAILYSSERMAETKEETILVYDLGGGTFDISVIHSSSEAIEVICTEGDPELGGKNWDDQIMAFLLEKLASELSLEIEEMKSDLELVQILRNKAELIKKKLSNPNKPTAKETINFDGNRVRIELSREEFDEFTQDLIKKTIYLTNKVIRDAEEKGFENISEIILVGGSSRMLQVREALQKEYPEKGLHLFDPDEAVAKGAAIVGEDIRTDNEIARRIGIIKQKTGASEVKDDIIEQIQEEVAEDKGYTLHAHRTREIIDVTSKSLGLEVNDGGTQRVSNIILRNSQIPIDMTKIYYWPDEQAEQIAITVMENNEDDEIVDLSLCTEVQNTYLHIGPGMRKGSPIEVTFSIDKSGILNVTAKDPESGKEVEMKVAINQWAEGGELEEAKERTRTTETS